MVVRRGVGKLFLIKLVLELGIIDSIGRLRYEDFSGNIKCAEIGPEIRSKDGAASDTGSKRHNEYDQINRQHQNTDELNVRTV